MIHIEHITASRLFINGLLGLLFRPNKEDVLPFGYNVANELIGFFEELDGFLEINDINPISCPKDIGLHFGVPTFRLMAEMNPSLQKFFHGYIRHETPRFFFIFLSLDKNKSSLRLSALRAGGCSGLTLSRP